MFDQEFLKELEYLSFVSRKVKRNGGRVISMANHNIRCDGNELYLRRQLRRFGNGTRFADHRVYVSGDDLRHFDWNLYSRLGEYFTKRYEVDEDVYVYFFLDCSKSMQAGDGNLNKFVYASRFVAALAYLGLSDSKYVSVIPFANQLGKIFPPTRGKWNFFNLIRFLEQSKPILPATNLQTAVCDFINKTKRTGIVFIVSDFFEPVGYQAAIDQLRYCRFEPIMIQVHTDFEADPMSDSATAQLLNNNCTIANIENESAKNNSNSEELNLIMTESILKKYKKCFGDFLETIRNYCNKNNISCSISRTSVPYNELILEMMTF
jgi:hypothetical protein